MKIHKSDAKAIMGSVKGFGVRDHGFKDWRDILALVENRAIERVGVLNERRIMGRCMDAFIEA